MNIYETRKLVDEYLLFHYASAAEVLPWSFGPEAALSFAVRSVSQLIGSVPAGAVALDLGCAVGRSAFELRAQGCASVLGIDYSQAFVDAAAAVQRGEALSYQRLEEAAVTTQLTAAFADAALRKAVSFEQGDAMNLRADLGSYDVVHAANLLCRLTQPELLLNRLPSLVKPGGQLLLTTPCTWLAEFTPPENWPTGRTLDWLRSRLEEHFVLEQEQDLPFLIRETARKFQWTVAMGTRLRRRG
jgi:putative 4-mercaptohistidine N1-methyltranferase